ncbi:hypothetical protein XELAEV_180016482mg, partial [Xenopus laevis]
MENAVLSLYENENKAAVEKALEHYETEMAKRVVFPIETMNQFMDLSKEYESFRDKDHHFQKELMVRQTFQFIIINNCQWFGQTNMQNRMYTKKKNELLKKNEEASVTYCDDLLANKIVGQYNEDTKKGIKGDEVLQRFLKSKEGTGNTILISDKALGERRKLKKVFDSQIEERE